ncbi:MAG: AbrB/MazE/SpoVT family DNA-binding domain-containing protein [Deltaproteobacteria bacterium]|nr:AbrB/MazE/SpoVT family DNA-binding domain-containing protein [Deltaproteobacteria bacterium]
MATSMLSTKGQIVIPADVRADMQIEPGSRVEFVRTDEGWLMKPATRPITALKGFLRHAKPVSIDEMNRAIRRRASASR